MKILLLLVVLIFFFAIIATAIVNADGGLPELNVRTPHDEALEKRRQRSESISAAEVENMDIKDIREHLSWRGEPCADCQHKRHLQQTLVDHINTKTELTAKKYSQTSAQLQSWRMRQGLGDNPHGNDPESKHRRFESRRKRNQNTNDPLNNLRNVLGSHGYDTNTHPYTQTHTGQKEMADFLLNMKKRAKNHDPGKRDPTHHENKEEMKGDL